MWQRYHGLMQHSHQGTVFTFQQVHANYPDLVPRVSHLTLPEASKGGKMSGPGNEVVITLDFSNQLGVKGGIPNFK